ncbi:MAG: ribosome maturation factor [Saprospiraceae bacterium]
MEERIIDLLEGKLADPAFADCFWLDVSIDKGKKLEIIIDADTGVTFEKCRQISRYLEGFIDEAGWLGEDYTIEVSSPGADRPLERPRQYPKHIGRRLEVQTQAGETIEGQLTAATDDHIVLLYEEQRKEGNKKVKENIAKTIPFTEIAKAQVIISFK